MITLALTLLALPQVELNAQQTKLINAIIQVESSGKDDAVGDNGKAIGCLQIWKPYWLDATERSNIGGKHTDCFKRDYAVRIFDAYMNRYAGAAWQSQSAFNPEFVARIHNGGPKGYKKTATIKYWKKVKILLDMKRGGVYNGGIQWKTSPTTIHLTRPMRLVRLPMSPNVVRAMMVGILTMTKPSTVIAKWAITIWTSTLRLRLSRSGLIEIFHPSSDW